MKNTAQAFFVWIGVLVALIVSCTSIILLWFGLIDAVMVGYPDGYGIQTYAAALIIGFPLFVWLTRMIHTSEREEKTPHDSWVRTWSLYAILFLSGLTIAIDVFIVLSSFLSGEELTASFLLKSVCAAAILVATFWYFSKELGRYWVNNKSRSELVAMCVGTAVLFSIALLFVIIGSPAHMRKVASDKMIVSELQSIQYQIIDYWQRKGKLPQALEEINDPISGYKAPLETSAQYEYLVKSPKEFELCAQFATTYKNMTNDSYSSYEGATYWEHAEGRTCFTRVVDEDKYPVMPKPVPSSI